LLAVATAAERDHRDECECCEEMPAERHVCPSSDLPLEPAGAAVFNDAA